MNSQTKSKVNKQPKFITNIRWQLVEIGRLQVEHRSSKHNLHNITKPSKLETHKTIRT